MSILSKAVLLFLSLCLTCILRGEAAHAQTIQFTTHEIALKSGESAEIGDVFSISTNCKSLLKSTPTVEVLEGPPGVTAAINAANVVPRNVGCAKPVGGGKLVVTAKDIQEHSFTQMVVR